MTARYIAIDWGSTNLRAWLYQGEECLESRQSEAGVTRLNGRSPAAVLAEITTALARWRHTGGDGRDGRQQRGLENRPLFAASCRFLGYWPAVNCRWRQYLDNSRPLRFP